MKKYDLALPLYRQEQDRNRNGVQLNRKTLANWVIAASERYLQPLYQQMKKDLLRRQILHADETEVEVLRDRAERRNRKAGCGFTTLPAVTPEFCCQSGQEKSERDEMDSEILSKAEKAPGNFSKQ